ncbi:uncharacterized protein LOC144164712 [Haemaphysalis longicornis]
MGPGGCAEERVCAKFGVCMRGYPVVLSVSEECLVLCTTGVAADTFPKKVGSPRQFSSGHRYSSAWGETVDGRSKCQPAHSASDVQSAGCPSWDDTPRSPFVIVH